MTDIHPCVLRTESGIRTEHSFGLDGICERCYFVEPYEFVEKPAAKSSTSVTTFTSKPGGRNTF